MGRVLDPELSVLVVEDDDAARDALVTALRALGYRCRGARDGQEGWEIHRADHADIILSDWQMPRMDGLELCRRTRVAHDQGAYTYFIFLTNYSDREHFLRGMEAGADDYHTKPVDLDELRARLASAGRVVALYRKLAEQNAALRRDSRASFRLARTDSLTQVANRLSLDEELKVLWARVVRYGQRYALAILDVDRFKSYNDAFGHLAGDEALRRIAHAIRETLREGDGLYRFGGDEFVVLLPEQPPADAVRALDRIRLAVEHLAIPASAGRVVSVSYGLAQADASVDRSPEQWLRRADAALYRAKREGRRVPDSRAPPSQRA